MAPNRALLTHNIFPLLYLILNRIDSYLGKDFGFSNHKKNYGC